MAGFIVGKTYYLLLAFGDRVFSRGAARKGLLLSGLVIVAVFWAYSSLLHMNVINFPWPLPSLYGGTTWMLNSGLPLGISRSPKTDVLAVVIFATYPFWFYLGTELGKAGHRLTRSQRTGEKERIIREVANAEFPRGGVLPPGAEDVDTAGSVEALMREIPALFEDAISILLFVFDSRFFVLAFTGRWKRFVDLDTKQKMEYIAVWQNNAFLVSMAQVLRMTMSYGFYTKPAVYRQFGYNGPMEPALPPWYNPGPEPSKNMRKNEDQAA